MKELLQLLLLSVFLISCGGSSESSSSWSADELDECKQEMLSEMEKDTASLDMFGLLGISKDEFISCSCDQLSKKFESFEVASVEIENLSEEEGMSMMMPCFGDLEQMMTGIQSELDEILDSDSAL